MFRFAVGSALLCATAACVADLGSPTASPLTDTSPTDTTSPATDEAPLIGVEGAGDFADRACQIVLHDAGRVQQGNGYATVEGSSSWLFDARVDVNKNALAEGFTPMLLVRSGSDAGWRAIEAEASTSISTNSDRFLFMIDEGNLPSAGMSATGLSRAKVSLIPFLTRGDARLFDHNRLADAFAVYELTLGNDFAVGVDPAVCAPPAGPTLTFNADWSIDESGAVVAGRTVTVDYDLARLPNCRAGYAGRPAFNIQAHALFLPMNVHQEASVLDGTRSTSSMWFSRPVAFDVPVGATSMQMWFHNTDRAGCNRYDSNFGDNYSFDVVDVVEDDGANAAAPDWMGNVTATISRGASGRCDGAVAFGNTLAFGTWARQRAAVTDLCFEVYEPGVTDFDNADVWQQLDAQVDVRFTGADDVSTSYVAFVRRVGNNAQYAIDLRAFDPFIWGRCSDGLPLSTVDENGVAMVQATAELSVRVNGAALENDGGDVFRVVYSDYADAPRVSCEP
jgi:hypothetical protein